LKRFFGQFFPENFIGATPKFKHGTEPPFSAPNYPWPIGGIRAGAPPPKGGGG